MKSYIKTYKAVLFDIMVISVSFVIMAISILLGVFLGEWHWFSRSGALIVLTGAILEYRNSMYISDGRKSYRYIFQNGVAVAEEGGNINIILKKLAHTLVIFGTIVWAYGDLIS